MRNKTLLIMLVFAILIGLISNRANLKNLPAVTSTASVAAPTATTTEVRAIPSTAETYYRVLKVVDGDTLAVEMGGKNVTIRLIGLDTPETVDPRKPVQCFGKEASDKAKEMLAGKSVRIEMDASQGELDKYGRLLAYVYLPDGVLFNKLMIELGFGHEYTYNLPYKYQKEFKAAEIAARERKVGLWGLKQSQSDCSPEPASQKSDAGLRTDGHDCSHNVYNCSSFKTQAEAQHVFDLCLTASVLAQADGGDVKDIHKLDRDGDGKVCESLP